MLRKICTMLLVIISVLTIQAMLYSYELPDFCFAWARCNGVEQDRCEGQDWEGEYRYYCQCGYTTGLDFNIWYIYCEGITGDPYVPYYNSKNCEKWHTATCAVYP